MTTGTQQGNSRIQIGGVTLMAVGLVLVALRYKDWLDVGSGPRLRKWEETLGDAIIESHEGNRSAADDNFRRAIEQAGPAPQRVKANEIAADTLLAGRRTADAMPYLATALQIRERSAKPGDAQVSALRLRLADLHMTLGDLPAARSLLERELAEDKSTAIDARRRMADLSALEGRDSEAEGLYSQVVTDVKSQRGEWDVGLTNPYLGLAGLFLERGDLDHAEKELLLAMDCCQRVGAADLISRCQLGLAEVYRQQGRARESADLLGKYLSRASVEDRLAPQVRVRIMRDQAQLLTSAGLLDEAAKLDRRADFAQAAVDRQRAEQGGIPPPPVHTDAYRQSWRRTLFPVVSAPEGP